MEISKLYSRYLEHPQICTDTRNIIPDSIFVCLKGERFDGNQFALSALEQGASYVITENAALADNPRCIVVENSLETLQQLAAYHRQQLTIPVIGITGTNGKTTTKELVSTVLAQKFRTAYTKGNLNNHIGVPLTLLSIKPSDEIAIVEMGANHPGEIDFLCNIANPEFGLITNVGKAHLEGFGSFKGVIRTKTELYKHLAAMAGVIFVNSDNEILMERAEKMSQLPSSPSVLPGVIPSIPGAKPSDYTDDFKVRGVNMPMASVVTYGSSETAECKGAFVSADPYMKFYFEDDDNVYTVQSQLIGAYNYDNAMAAVCVGRYFGVELFDIKTAIEEYCPSNNRSQFKRTERNALVLDCYNANPSSMGVAVDNFIAMKADNKVVMLGGMKELGGDSKAEHRKLFDKVKGGGFGQIVLVGDEFRFAEGEKDVLWFANSGDALAHLKANQLSGATILIKGSNSNKMWVLEEAL